MSGTAGNAADYQQLFGSAVIPAGQSSTTVNIVPLSDGITDPNETAILTISGDPTHYAIGTPGSATVTIQ